MMNIEMEKITQLPTDTTSFMNNETMTSNIKINENINNTQTETTKRRRKRKSSSEKTDGEKKKSKKSKGTLKCVYCAAPLSSKYCFCPECGNAIPKDISKEEINQMTERYKELERSNADLEKQYQIYQFQQQQLAEQQQAEQQQQTMTELMWLVASIPRPLLNEKISLSDYTITKISPAFAEFLGFQENKQLINAKMSKIVPSLPSHLSSLHTDYMENLSLKEDNTSFSKQEVFKNLYDELYLTTLQCTLYSSEKKPSLCIMVMTGYSKIDNIDSAFPNLNAPFQEISESQEN